MVVLVQRLGSIALALALACLAGCKDDEPVHHLPDGPPIVVDAPIDPDGPDLDMPIASATSCAEPIHTDATATILATGSVADYAGLTGNGNMLAGVQVTLNRLAGGAALGTATSDISGIYELTATTGGAAVDGYFELSGTGFVTLRYYPRAPLYKGGAVRKLSMLTTAEAASIATAAGVTQDPAKGIAIVRLTSCQGSTQEGFAVSVSGPCDIRYLDAGGTTFTASATSSAGFAVVFNIPPGTVSIGATNGTTIDYGNDVAIGTGFLSYVELSEP